MNRVLLLGAGKIGGAIATFLASSGEYDVLVADSDSAALKRLGDSAKVSTVTMSVSDAASLKHSMAGRSAVISALSFALNPAVANAALESGLSYFDLTEDRETTLAVRDYAKCAKAGQVFMPQCGLAPGFVSIAAYDLARQFDAPEVVRMRVGALPQFPTNEMKYNLTWSTDGLINEYGNPCEAIHEGRRIEVLPLEGLEHFSLDGVHYEAFNTSGGVGTLCETLANDVRTLDYKTIRYLGHRDLMAFLMNELRLNDRRTLLKEILENAVPHTLQDVVVIFCTATGQRDGQMVQLCDARKVYHQKHGDEVWSAIQITTAAAVCAAVDLHVQGQLPPTGFVRQEQVDFDTFLANRFGQHYVGPGVTLNNQ